MTQRERYIAYTVGAVIGLAGLNYIVDAQMAARADLDVKIQDAQRGLNDETRLIQRKAANKRKLETLINTSLTRNSPEAGTQLQARVLECLLQANINPLQAGYSEGSPSPVKVGARSSQKDAAQFMKLTSSITLKSSNMSQLSRFAYLINSSDIPVRISDMQISPTKENTDDFNVEIKLATVFLTQSAEAARVAGNAGAAIASTRGSTSSINSSTGPANQNVIGQQAGRSGMRGTQNQSTRGAGGTPTTGPTEARP